LNKIYKKYREYDTYKEVIEDIKTVEINGFCTELTWTKTGTEQAQNKHITNKKQEQEQE